MIDPIDGTSLPTTHGLCAFPISDGTTEHEWVAESWMTAKAPHLSLQGKDR